MTWDPLDMGWRTTGLAIREENVKIKDILKLAISIVLCQLTGFLGSLFTAPAIPTWYKTLKKPFFSPPNWIFSPVWISLFILMGISLFMVWRKQDHPRFKITLIFFLIWDKTGRATIIVNWSTTRLLRYPCRACVGNLLATLRGNRCTSQPTYL